MRILHYLPRILLAEGGVVRAVLDICTIMAARGHDVTLATCDATDAPKSWTGEGGTPSILRVDAPTGPLGFYKKPGLAPFRTAIAESDVVHLHTPWETPNVQLGSLARKAGVPYVLTVHGMLDDWCMQQRGPKKKLYLALAGRKLLERAARVHCTAGFEKTQSEKWFPGGQGMVIPLVFDLSEFENLPGPDLAREKFEDCSTDAPVVLFLSRIHYKKGPELLVEAASVLKARGTDVKVLFAGTADDPAYEKSVRDLVEQKGVSDRVRFLGLVTGTEKLSLYEAADVFVLPTSQENFGFVFPEALACRTPVITTKGVDIWPELIESGGALIVDRDAQEIADAITSVVSDREKAAEMGEKGRAWVMDYLDSERIAGEFEGLYETALKTRRS